jgi:hypothetical protein
MPGSEGAAGERQRGEGAPNEQAAAVSRARTCTDEPETPPSASSRLESRTKAGFWGSLSVGAPGGGVRRAGACAEHAGPRDRGVSRAVRRERAQACAGSRHPRRG